MNPMVRLILFCFCCGASGCVTSISDAVKKNGDLLPKPHYVFLPLTSASRLGRLPATNIDDSIRASRRLTVDPRPCFFVAPTVSNALSEIKVEYKSSQDVGVELSQVNTNIGGSVDVAHENKATLAMKGLKVNEAIGVPDLNSACEKFFSESKRILVVTAETVAGSLSLDYTDATKAKLKAAGVVPQAGVKIGGNVGWEWGTSGTIVAKDLVIGGQVKAVNVTVKKTETDLGATPLIGQKVDFPAGFEGSLTVQGFDASQNKLTLSVSTALYASVTPPIEFAVCPVKTDHPLSVGKRCDFWLSSGSSLISVQWNYKMVGAEKHIILSVNGYGSRFDENPGELPADITHL